MTVGAAKFGLMAAAGSGATPLTAFGGIITQYVDSGTTYRVHTFRGSGKFVVSDGEADCDVLIIAGGGSGAGNANANAGNGGGGAGGVVTASSVTVDTASSPYTITVGAGGAGGKTNAVGASGSSSSALGQTTAVGGGLGGRFAEPYPWTPAAGSGGGAGTNWTGGSNSGAAQSGQTATAGQGYAGGDASTQVSGDLVGCDSAGSVRLIDRSGDRLEATRSISVG